MCLLVIKGSYENTPDFHRNGVQKFYLIMLLSLPFYDLIYVMDASVKNKQLNIEKKNVSYQIIRKAHALEENKQRNKEVSGQR